MSISTTWNPQPLLTRPCPAQEETDPSLDYAAHRIRRMVAIDVEVSAAQHLRWSPYRPFLPGESIGAIHCSRCHADYRGRVPAVAVSHCSGFNVGSRTTACERCLAAEAFDLDVASPMATAQLEEIVSTEFVSVSRPASVMQGYYMPIAPEGQELKVFTDTTPICSAAAIANLLGLKAPYWLRYKIDLRSVNMTWQGPYTCLTIHSGRDPRKLEGKPYGRGFGFRHDPAAQVQGPYDSFSQALDVAALLPLEHGARLEHVVAISRGTSRGGREPVRRVASWATRHGLIGDIMPVPAYLDRRSRYFWIAGSAGQIIDAPPPQTPVAPFHVSHTNQQQPAQEAGH